VEGSPGGRHSRQRTRATRARNRPGRWTARARLGRRLTATIGVTTAIGLLIPAATAGAAVSAPASTPASLKTLLARAAKLSAEIDNLSQSVDALRIQLSQARQQVSLARLTIRRDQRLLATDQSALGLIAAAGYMSGGINPSLQLLQSSNPQAMLNRASILTQLQHENGTKLSLVAAARAAATRARLLALQQEQRATRLSAAMRIKVARIQTKENLLNSAAFAQAMAIYQQTGRYPQIQVTGNSVGVQALRYALTRVGDPYVWGAAGPNAFDCSGLVVWAYAQIGISLPHYTGYLWNSGVHISRSQLEPGDLVFFFADIGHVGIYVGGGMMVDAPTFGQPVQVQPVFWNAYVGAVRIA
jgi:cell wall-associated NlpC family hydrolase